MDNFALSSFGVRYGVTDKLSVDVWRSPSFIARPIQLMAAYNILDEHHEQPFNLAFRVSIEGQDNFRKNYTVVRNLLNNPKTPLDVSLHMLPMINAVDLKRLTTSKNIPETLRTTAIKLQKQRSEFKK